MAKAPHTTNPSDERNSVSDMVFDMDDNLTRLQANLNVLEELTKSYKLAGATDHQEAVDWTIWEVRAATNELRQRFDKVFHATRGRGQAKLERAKSAEPEREPEPEQASVPWSKLLCKEWTPEIGEAIYGKEQYAAMLAKREARAEKMKEREAVPLHERWSELFAEWLTIEAAWAATDGNSDVPDEVGDSIQEQEAALVQRMIVAKPRLGYEVAQKLTVLEKHMSSDEWADRRDWLLLGSLKRDVADLSRPATKHGSAGTRCTSFRNCRTGTTMRWTCCCLLASWSNRS